MTSAHECHFIDSKSPSLMHLHHRQQQLRKQQQLQLRNRIKSSDFEDANTMHFSAPSKCSINTNFTNLNVTNDSCETTLSRQSLIGELFHLYDSHPAAQSFEPSNNPFQNIYTKNIHTHLFCHI